MASSSSAPLGTEGDGDGGADGVDVPAELRAAFTNERCAPELLPHEAFECDVGHVEAPVCELVPTHGGPRRRVYS